MSLGRISSRPELRKSEKRLPWPEGDVHRSTTVTRADLVDAVMRQFGASRLESKQIVEGVLAEIAAALVRGESVKLSGFGSFNQHSKSARPGCNPKNGVKATVSPRRVLSFKPSQILRRLVSSL